MSATLLGTPLPFCACHTQPSPAVGTRGTGTIRKQTFSSLVGVGNKRLVEGNMMVLVLQKDRTAMRTTASRIIALCRGQ